MFGGWTYGAVLIPLGGRPLAEFLVDALAQVANAIVDGVEDVLWLDLFGVFRKRTINSFVKCLVDFTFFLKSHVSHGANNFS